MAHTSMWCRPSAELSKGRQQALASGSASHCPARTHIRPYASLTSSASGLPATKRSGRKASGWRHSSGLRCMACMLTCRSAAGVTVQVFGGKCGLAGLPQACLSARIASRLPRPHLQRRSRRHIVAAQLPGAAGWRLSHECDAGRIQPHAFLEHRRSVREVNLLGRIQWARSRGGRWCEVDGATQAWHSHDRSTPAPNMPTCRPSVLLL